MSRETTRNNGDIVICLLLLAAGLIGFMLGLTVGISSF
jgi:hypothetical protein